MIGMWVQIDLDPCSNSSDRDTANVPAADYWTKDDDGLAQEWHGRVYMNPPYGDEIAAWVERMVRAYENSEIAEAIALLPARTDTAWYQTLADYRMCFIRGRLKFSNSENSAPFPSVVVYLGTDVANFYDFFGKLGFIMTRLPATSRRGRRASYGGTQRDNQTANALPRRKVEACALDYRASSCPSRVLRIVRRRGIRAAAQTPRLCRGIQRPKRRCCEPDALPARAGLRRELAAAVQWTPYSRAEFDATYEPTDDPIERARRTLLQANAGSTTHQSTRRTGFRSDTSRAGTIPAHDWRSLPPVLLAIGERLQGVVIEDDDALTVMQRYDTADTLHYLDPPYLAETRNARQAGMAYAVDMATPAQHRALIAVARELRGHVVISGYPSALYAELLGDWTMVLKSTHAKAPATV